MANGTIASHAFDPARPLIDYIAQTARQNPDAPAILLRDSRLTYGQMMQRVEAVAAALCAAGVKRGDFVGLAFTRSQDNLLAMLGTLRAGAGFDFVKSFACGRGGASSFLGNMVSTVSSPDRRAECIPINMTTWSLLISSMPLTWSPTV